MAKCDRCGGSIDRDDHGAGRDKGVDTSCLSSRETISARESESKSSSSKSESESSKSGRK